MAYANRAFRRRFGIEDFEGRRCHELVFHEFRPCSACGRICPMERAGLSGQPERTIERDFVPGGERFVELEVVPVPAPDGAAVYFMEQVLVRDDPQSVREREGIVMHSAAVQQTVAAIGRVAASDVPVLFVVRREAVSQGMPDCCMKTLDALCMHLSRSTVRL